MEDHDLIVAIGNVSPPALEGAAVVRRSACFLPHDHLCSWPPWRTDPAGGQQQLFIRVVVEQCRFVFRLIETP